MYDITNLFLSVFKVSQCNNSPKLQSNFITLIFFFFFFIFFFLAVSLISNQIGSCDNHVNST